MKKILFFALTGIFALGAMTLGSCSGDGKGKGNGNGNVTNSDIVGKWELGSNDSGLVSLEFGGSDNYVAVIDESLVRAAEDYVTYFGTYTIKGDVVTLSGLGKVQVNSVGGGAIDLLFTPQGSSQSTELGGGKAAEMASTTKTDLLCGTTWKIVDFEGSDDQGSIPGRASRADEEEDYDPEFVYFSKAGTYLVTFTNGDAQMSNWRWKSEPNGEFEYSEEFPPVWDGSYAKIETLNANNFVVYEEYGVDSWNRTWCEPVK